MSAGGSGGGSLFIPVPPPDGMKGFEAIRVLIFTVALKDTNMAFGDYKV